MARSPILTIKVEDTQFQQFMKSFNDLSSKIKNLSTQFNQLNNTIKKTSLATQALQASFNAINTVSKSILSNVGGITKHFIRWSTIIGSVTALLGMGGGLFGIERLAASIQARRRQMLGLGGDWGATRAAEIHGQTLFGGGTSNILQNIRMGTGGSQDQLSALMAMGVPYGTKKSPEELLTEILPKVHKILKSAGPNLALSVAKGYGLDKIFTDPMDLIRLSTEDGMKEIQLREERIRKDKELLKLSPEAQKGWENLRDQLLSAGAQIETIFGEKLASLSQPLSELSKEFVRLVRAFMDSPLVERAIRKLSKWMEDFAKELEESKLDDKLKEFSDYVESWIPYLKQFKQTISDLTDVINNAARILKPVDRAVTPPGWANDFYKDATKWLRDQFLGGGLSRGEPGSPGAPSGFAPSPDTAAPSTGGTGKQSFNVPGSSLFAGGSRALTSLAGNTFGGNSFGGATVRTASFGGNTGIRGGAVNSTSGTTAMNFGGGISRNYAAFSGGPTTGGSLGQLFAGGTTNVSAPSVRMASWNGAVNKAAPRGGNSNVSISSNNKMAMGMFGRGNQGPLSVDNWQSNRTASLTIRNVPGSNVFMSGAGMAV
jgi:hypothetical protein